MNFLATRKPGGFRGLKIFLERGRGTSKNMYMKPFFETRVVSIFGGQILGKLNPSLILKLLAAGFFSHSKCLCEFCFRYTKRL